MSNDTIPFIIPRPQPTLTEVCQPLVSAAQREAAANQIISAGIVITLVLIVFVIMYRRLK